MIVNPTPEIPIAFARMFDIVLSCSGEYASRATSLKSFLGSDIQRNNGIKSRQPTSHHEFSDFLHQKSRFQNTFLIFTLFSFPLSLLSSLLLRRCDVSLCNKKKKKKKKRMSKNEIFHNLFFFFFYRQPLAHCHIQ